MFITIEETQQFTKLSAPIYISISTFLRLYLEKEGKEEDDIEYVSLLCSTRVGSSLVSLW